MERNLRKPIKWKKYEKMRLIEIKSHTKKIKMVGESNEK